MIKLKNSFSKIVALLVIGWFTFQFSIKITEVIENKSTCVCAYDGYGYYMYLPAFFENGSLDIQKEWAEKLQHSYCSNDLIIYQLQPVENSKFVNIYHMGLAFVQLPSYFIADQFAAFLGYNQDGFSKPYHIAYLLNTLLFILLGILYLRKLLLLFFDEWISGMVMLILYFCSNIYPTFIDAYQLTHLYLFTFNALLLFHFFKFVKTEQKRYIIYSALFFGITCFIRPSQAIWGIIPLIILWKKFGFTKKMIGLVAFFPLAAILLNIPHLVYWKTIGGQLLLMNLHTEDIVLTDPNFWNFLFSYRKGWLLYTPIFLLIIPGFIYLYRNNKNIFWALLSFVIIDIYVLCSWECWWYAASYSSRVMIDSYPLLAIIIGFAILGIHRNKILKVAATIFVISCLILNSIQIIQLKKYYLHVERMSKQHYWYIFGRTNIPNYVDYRLEIDRGNVNWIENQNFKKDPNFSIEKKQVFNSNKRIELNKNTGTTIGKIELSNLLTTDETLFEISIRCKSSDSTIVSQFRFEQTGKHNTYSWANIELSKDLPQNQWNEVRFKVNEAYLRHTDDFIQLYTLTEGNAKVEIESVKVIARSLIRN